MAELESRTTEIIFLGLAVPGCCCTAPTGRLAATAVAAAAAAAAASMQRAGEELRRGTAVPPVPLPRPCTRQDSLVPPPSSRYTAPQGYRSGQILLVGRYLAGRGGRVRASGSSTTAPAPEGQYSACLRCWVQGRRPFITNCAYMHSYIILACRGRLPRSGPAGTDGRGARASAVSADVGAASAEPKRENGDGEGSCLSSHGTGRAAGVRLRKRGSNDQNMMPPVPRLSRRPAPLGEMALRQSHGFQGHGPSLPMASQQLLRSLGQRGQELRGTWRRTQSARPSDPNLINQGPSGPGIGPLASEKSTTLPLPVDFDRHRLNVSISINA